MSNSSIINNTSGKATSMAELMQKSKTSFVTLRKGEPVKGRITKLSSSEILVNVGAKAEAIVLEKERHIMRNLLRMLKVGDEVTVGVLSPESEIGNPIVSLRRFIDDLIWESFTKKQEAQEQIKVTVKEVTKGGYIAETEEAIFGFMPNSQLISQAENPEMVGKHIPVYILEQNRQAHKLLFSQKPLMNDKQFEEIVKTLKSGQKINVVVTHIANFGVFAAVPVGQTTIDGLIHISEVAWEKTEDMAGIFTVGQTVEAVVIGIDREAKRIDLSVKRLTADPYQEALKKYSPEQKITGTVIKVFDGGIALNIEDASIPEGKIEAIIRKEKIPPTTTYEVGQTITITINEIDTKRHRLIVVPVLKEKPIGYR